MAPPLTLPTPTPIEDESGDNLIEKGGDDERYDAYFQSVRSPTGLEIAVKVTWPGFMEQEPPIELELSTCLPEDEIAPMFSGTQWAGTRVWRAAVVALQYLQKSSHIQSDSTVLELGCGLGVPGILLHKLFDCSVVLTDMDMLVSQLRENLASNGLTNDRLQAQPLDWSVKGLEELFEASKIKKFDIVLNCDCIFEPLYGDSWKMLLKVQEALLKANPETYMLTSCERRNFDGIDLYLQGLEDSSVVSKVEKLSPDFEYPHEVELYRIYGVPASR